MGERCRKCPAKNGGSSASVGQESIGDGRALFHDAHSSGWLLSAESNHSEPDLGEVRRITES